jgi:dTDP-glucose 4,6-dehydratase
MHLLVTGGAGFIGSNFIRHMLDTYPEYRITNLDKLTYAGNLENLRDVENDSRYAFVKGDVCDRAVVDRAASDADVIVNFAAETHVDRSITGPEPFVRTDILGTLVLLEAARKYKHRKYVQISTDEVYGSILEGSFTEQSDLKPNSPYSASKAGADLLVRSFFVTFGVPAVITRSSNNFGPYQYPEKVIPLFVTNAFDDIPVPLYGDGLNVRDWLYVLDNCRAIDLVIHKGLPGEVYNIGGGYEIPNVELTRKILSLCGKDETLIKRVPDRPGHDRRYSLDCVKVKALGWEPQASFDEELAQTVQWYRDNRAWWEKLKKQT